MASAPLNLGIAPWLLSVWLMIVLQISLTASHRICQAEMLDSPGDVGISAILKFKMFSQKHNSLDLAVHFPFQC